MLKKIEELPLSGKKVLVRVDFNVPLTKDHEISDDTRIVATLPTIEYLLKQGALVILMSHLGRPNGEKNSAYSLYPCAKRLSELLKKPVKMAHDCIGPSVKEAVDALKEGEVLLLENVRFYKAEEDPKEDLGFAKELASLGDFYINDAFGVSHRAHSSVTEIVPYFRGRCAPGFLLEKEIDFLGKTLLNPKRPFYAIVGGAKVSSKLGVLHSLLNKVDKLFIGGGMAYTFFKAMGIFVGDSICENDLLDAAKEVMEYAKVKGVELKLPVDVVCASHFANDAEIKIVDIKDDIPNGFMGMDIGPKTIEEWSLLFKEASVLFWNGPVGVFEFDNFSKGSEMIAKALANSAGKTIVGGGDSIAALQKLHLGERMTHISTGGGASLEYIEFGKLPGITALDQYAF